MFEVSKAFRPWPCSSREITIIKGKNKKKRELPTSFKRYRKRVKVKPKPQK
jgi:hypothetical protein